MVTPKTRLKRDLRGESATVTGGVPVGGGGVSVRDGEGGTVVGLGVMVDVAGGVTCNINF